MPPPPQPSDGPIGPTGTAVGPADPSPAEAVPLQEPGPTAFRWAVAAVVAVLALTEVFSRLFVWVGDDLRVGSAPAFLNGAALLLLTPALIFAAVRYFAVRRVGLTPFGMGLRRPASIIDAAILGVAVWFCFLLFVASWVVLTTPKDELERKSSAIQQEEPIPTVAVPGPTLPTASEPTIPASADATPDAVEAKDDRHVLLKVLGDNPPLRVLILILIATCIAAPIFEELFFRGFLFRAFAGRFGPTPAMLLSGALFGLAHAFVIPLRMTVPLGIMGVALAWLLQQTRSLIPGMAVHGFVNALGSGISAGFGPHTATLIVGTWVVLIVILLPWLRRSVVVAPLGG